VSTATRKEGKKKRKRDLLLVAFSISVGRRGREKRRRPAQ